MAELVKTELAKTDLVKTGVGITVDGETMTVAEGSTLASVLMQRGDTFRRSVAGEPRQPLCAMGTCFECRVTVDGVPHVRACRVVVRDGMEVETAEGDER